MWPRMLRQWLERQSLISQQQRVEELRARRENEELVLQNASVLPWLFPPPC